MEDRNKKELIAIIKEGLKDAELPYKEGAWETYKSKYEQKSVRKIVPAYWAAAAALALAGFTTFFILRNSPDEPLRTAQQVVREEQKQTDNPKIAQGSDLKTGSEAEDISETPLEASTSASDLLAFEDATAVSNKRPFIDLAFSEAGKLDQGSSSFMQVAPKAPQLLVDIPAPKLAVSEQESSSEDVGNRLAMAKQTNLTFVQEKESGKSLTPKRYAIGNKLEMGAFLSPSTTDQGFDVGGGLMLAYELSNKLALRTGASFNQYEVGMLASAGGPSASPAALDAVSERVPYRTSNLLLPDLNSVSGKVQTLDIPLEVRYTIGKQFYAIGGVSYALVLSQERFDNFTEYTDVATFSSASESGQPTTPASATVQTSVQSTQNNVNPNGFGGFVNFSVGRKTNLTKFMKISIEPYIKIPVGQFKNADMDYTNGGLRVITNF